MRRIVIAALMAVVAFNFIIDGAFAASKERYKPFVLATQGAGDLDATAIDVRKKLKSAGLELIDPIPGRSFRLSPTKP